MKQKLIYSFIILSVLLCNINLVFASTNTYTRPSDNLGITKDIDITSSRKSIIEKTPYVDSSEKIYDFANLLTDKEEEELFSKIQTFIENTNLDMVIVTIDDNNKSTSMAYADDFYDYNDFGLGNKDDGILFLIDMDNREIWISTTGKAIDIYDSHIDSILDKCYNYISNENYYKTATTFIDSAQNTYDSNIRNGWIIGFTIAGIISLLIPTIFCIMQKSKHKAVKLATNANNYLIKSSVNITNSSDRFLHSHTSKISKGSSSSGSGGSHSGSSGISHGGGGRSF